MLYKIKNPKNTQKSIPKSKKGILQKKNIFHITFEYCEYLNYQGYLWYLGSNQQLSFELRYQKEELMNSGKANPGKSFFW